MEELGASLEDPNAPDQLHLQEGDMLDKIRIMDKFLAFWIPEQIKAANINNQNNRIS